MLEFICKSSQAQFTFAGPRSAWAGSSVSLSNLEIQPTRNAFRSPTRRPVIAPEERPLRSELVQLDPCGLPAPILASFQSENAEECAYCDGPERGIHEPDTKRDAGSSMKERSSWD